MSAGVTGVRDGPAAPVVDGELDVDVNVVDVDSVDEDGDGMEAAGGSGSDREGRPRADGATDDDDDDDDDFVGSPSTPRRHGSGAAGGTRGMGGLRVYVDLVRHCWRPCGPWCVCTLAIVVTA